MPSKPYQSNKKKIVIDRAQVEIENQHRQQLNDLTISKANEEIRVIQEKTRSTEAPLKLHPVYKQTVHEDREQKQADPIRTTVASKTPLRIVVDDDEYKSVRIRII